MKKYKIYQIISPEGEFFYCKEKWGPFWVAPSDYDLRLVNGSKNGKCRRFKTKQMLLDVIGTVRQRELESKTHLEKIQKTKHIPLEIV